MSLIRLQGRFERGLFLKRLNRFMVKAELNGRSVIAHLPNSGRLFFLLERRRIGRKSGCDLFAVEHSGVPIIVDTRFSTVAAQTAIKNDNSGC